MIVNETFKQAISLTL